LPLFFSLFFYIFSGGPQSNEFSEITGLIFTNCLGLDKFCIHLAVASGTLPWHQRKSENWRFCEKKFFVAQPF